MLPIKQSHEQYISFLKTMVKQLNENPLVTITDEDWALALKRTPIYTVISGFEPGNTPGIGTFYDFIDQLWLLDSDNLSDNIQPKHIKPKKPKKGEKADTLSKETVESLVAPFLDMPGPPCSDKFPYQRLFQVFKAIFVDRSREGGLLSYDSNILSSADGTPVVTSSAWPRYKKICDCEANGIERCDCDRYYSQPDCDSGWDSSRNKFFNGYHLYTYNACGSYYDLPLMPFLNKASQHDSISLVK